MRAFSVILALFLATTSVLVAQEARAEDPAEFFAGKTIRWVIPYRPGGGYDEYSRLIGPFFEKYSGASVELVNLPGTGGLKGSVEVYRAPADGLHIGLLNGSSLASLAIAGKDKPNIDLSQYSFVGRVAAEETVFVLSASSGLSGLDEIMRGDTQIIVGATGGGGSSFVDAKVPGEIFGFNQRIVSGFDSSSDIRLALLRGDIDGSWASYSTQMKVAKAEIGTPVLRTGRGPADGLEGVPSIFDFADGLDPQAMSLMEAWNGLSNAGRILLGPPGIPEDRIEFLGEALRQALEDPELQQMMTAAGRPATFLVGTEMREIVLRSLNADPEATAVLRAALAGE